MVSIPLAEVPNAPQVGGLVLAEGKQRGPDLSGAANSLMTPTIKQGAFDGAAQGLNAIGQGLSQIGSAGDKIAGVIQDAKRRKEEYQDDVSSATYYGRIAAARSNYKATLPGKSEDEYVSGWNNNFPKIRDEAMKGLTFSKRGIERVAVMDAQFNSETIVGLTTEANRSAMARGKDQILSFAQTLHDEGKDVEAKAALGRLVDLGAAFPGEVKEITRKWDAQRTEQQVNIAINDNPKAMVEDFSEALKTGKPPAAFKNMPVSGILPTLRQAEQALGQQQTQARQGLYMAIQEGGVSTPEQIEDYSLAKGDVLTEQDKDAARRKLINRYGPSNPATYGDLRAEALLYDPAEDLDGKKRGEIQRRAMAELPDKEADGIFRIISGLEQKGRTNVSEVRGSMSQLITQGYNDKWFGDFKTGKEEEGLSPKAKAENRVAIQQAAIKRGAFEDQVDKYIELHQADPDFSREKALNWAMEQLRPTAQAKAASNWSGSLSKFTPQWLSNTTLDLLFKRNQAAPKPTPAPGEAIKMIQESKGKTSSVIPNTTRYSLGADVGGPDELQDRWTNKGYSSTGQNLTPGVVAVNTKAHPIGTIFRDEAGNAYIAADKHGNKDANVVDIYEPPSVYGKGKQPKLQVVGKVDKVPGTVNGIRDLLAQYGNVPEGESAIESLKGRS